MKTHTTDYDMSLAEHFTLREMVASATAIRKGIKNVPSTEVINNLRALCQNVLEPLRRRFGVIRITSGYRCQQLNEAVGGVKNSQHIKGEAADVHVSSLEQARQMIDFIAGNLEYDQLLLERVMTTGCCWIHVSYVAQPGRRPNRRMTKEVRVEI